MVLKQEEFEAENTGSGWGRDGGRGGSVMNYIN